MASRTYLDIMHMIKNAYFCFAKIKVDDPDGQFWLILLGTDRLESAFGILRTMVGNDANADSLQLGDRLSHATQVANIFAAKPEWDRGPRRLRIPAMDASGQLSRDVDHITPTTWKGDVCVRHVVPLTCWMSGRQRIEREFAAHDFAAQLRSVEMTPGADMLSPFGQPLDPSVDEDEDDSVDEDSELTAPLPTLPDIGLEDLVGAVDTPESGAVCPTLLVGGKKVYKVRILRVIAGNPHKNSTDRMRRVADLPPYFTPTASSSTIDDSSVLGSGSLCLNDPIATGIRSEDHLLLCIGQLVRLQHHGRSLQSISSHLLVEDSVEAQFQILQLVDVSDPAGSDWALNG